MCYSVRYLTACVLMLSAGLVAGQDRADLNTDPVFSYMVTHRVQYPPQMASRAIYGRVYAGFTLDSAGRIRDIALRYPRMSRQMTQLYGIEYTIRAGLRRMPPLNPRYAGRYVLPIAFCYTHYAEGPAPIVPTNQLPTGFDPGPGTLLREVSIFAVSPSTLRSLNQLPPSRQIDRNVADGGQLP
jgi:hypothetical protein